MAMPGITGEVIRLRDNQVLSGNIATTWWRDYSGRWDNNLTAGSEPLLDALIYEPIPYRSAVNENCTDILVLRTRPDNITVYILYTLSHTTLHHTIHTIHSIHTIGDRESRASNEINRRKVSNRSNSSFWVVCYIQLYRITL